MRPVPAYLRNHEAVIRAFGYWPSFHDACVVGFLRDMTPPARVELVIHGWEMTNEVDDRGYFKLIKHHLVRFQFEGISNAELDQFTSGNILFGMDFSAPDEFTSKGVFEVRMDSAIGCEFSAAFCARAGEVSEVVPCDKAANRTETGGNDE